MEKKPVICAILGVEVGEQFKILDYSPSVMFKIKKDGTYETFPPNRVGSSRALLKAVNDPTMVIHIPAFTEDEKAVLRLLRQAGVDAVEIADEPGGRTAVLYQGAKTKRVRVIADMLQSLPIYEPVDLSELGR